MSVESCVTLWVCTVMLLSWVPPLKINDAGMLTMVFVKPVLVMLLNPTVKPQAARAFRGQPEKPRNFQPISSPELS